MVVPVFSWNIHEIRAYNRMASLARGKYLVLLGDDDRPPQDCKWLDDMVNLFERWPGIGVLGLRNFVAW